MIPSSLYVPSEAPRATLSERPLRAERPEDSDSPMHDDGLPVPIPAWRSLLVIALALFAGIGSVALIRARGPQPLPGTVRAVGTLLSAQRAGDVLRWTAAEGSAVDAGTPLLVLSDDERAARIAKLEADIERLAAEVRQLEAQAQVELAWRIKEVETELLDTKLRSATLLQEKLLREVEDLAWHDFVRAPHDVELASVSLPRSGSRSPLGPWDEEERLKSMLRTHAVRTALETFSAQVELCEQRIRDLEKVRNELPDVVRRAHGIEVAAERLRHAESERATLDDEDETRTVTAPAYGVVGRRQVRVGEHVAAGAVLVELFDDARRRVDVDLPTDRVESFPLGTRVAVVFPGEVRRQGRITRLPPQAQSGPVDGAPAVVRAEIEPVGEAWPVVPLGTAVTVRTDAE